jgi:hypothetical protein
MKPYAKRRISRQEDLLARGWQLKRYAVSLGGETFIPTRFAGARRLAVQALPSPARNRYRHGVGFLVEHQGDGIDYCVLGWWDRENELPLRVFVRPRSHGARWRKARGSESVCVWDLEVIWKERRAYIRAALSRGTANPRSRYLSS